MSGFLVQGRHGTKGNFEAVVPSSHGGGLVHLWRNNDAGMTWSGPTCFGGPRPYLATTLIQSNYGTTGNLEVLATTDAGELDFFWRMDRAPWTWSGPFRIATGVRGAPALIQGKHGTKGNFEVVVPHRDGGLAHLWRNNDAGMAWSAPGRFGGGARYAGATLVQSNYGSVGNLEVLATTDAGELDFFWRMDRAPWTWSGPFRVASGLRGTPSLVQGRHGTKGNFEVVVPHRDGGLAHLWRNNDAGMAWSAPGRFGGGARYVNAALVQSNYGSVGNLEVLATTQAGDVDFFWRMDRAPWTWSGPFRVGAEIGFSVSECTFGWRAAYHQADTHVTIRIQLNPDSGISDATMNTLRTTWRNGIIGKWSDRFDCVGNGQRKRFTFDVQWVTSGAHHVVRVRPGPDRSNMTTWDTSDTGDVASHEFGHMLGHPDEYATSACPARSPVSTGTVMDDNTETVARLYNRLASFHCGHTPAAAPGEGPSEVEGAAVELRLLDRMATAHRAEVLQRLRSADEGAEVSFEVTGGAPGERYEYRLAVSGSGAARRVLVDEFSAEPDADSTGTVPPETARRVFDAARDAGLLDDAPPELPPADLVPDSLVATVTVRYGDAVRRVSVPAVEPGREEVPGEARDVPVSTHVRLAPDTADLLTPVLAALSAVEAHL
ncbi:hypothetical protein AB0A74_10130 [Saccharothrix sp. NPDC042600]|uniref:hypothetical protein n=1 Tax=Saccharothrix TaxID=2071 RepID=UPI0033C9C1B5|nr:hypothetical protein GCM10017745_42670 [Saccharothrix mutabilis subsp. capreolus]